jgi:hypothetical protein
MTPFLISSPQLTFHPYPEEKKKRYMVNRVRDQKLFKMTRRMRD